MKKKVSKLELYHGDCLQIMDELIQKGIRADCIIVDPPYGINHKSNRRKDKGDMLTRRGILGDDNNYELHKLFTAKMNEITKEQAHIYQFTRWDKLDMNIPLLRTSFNVKNVLVWDKGNWGSGDLLGSYGNQYENIIYAMKGRKLLNVVDGKRRHSDILQFKKVASQKLVHPHQKPVELLEFLIKKSTEEGDLVIDLFMGSGSTGIACKNLNRDFIGIELDEKYYEVAKERIFDTK